MIQSLGARPFPPGLTLASLYTMRTRTRRACHQRVIGFNPSRASDRARLRELRHAPALSIWNEGYVGDGPSAPWQPARAAAAGVQMARLMRKRPRASSAPQK